MTAKISPIRRERVVAPQAAAKAPVAPKREKPEPKPPRADWPPRLAHPERLIATGTLGRVPEGSEIGSDWIVFPSSPRVSRWVGLAILLATVLIIFGVRR